MKMIMDQAVKIWPHNLGELPDFHCVIHDHFHFCVLRNKSSEFLEAYFRVYTLVIHVMD